MMFSDFLYFRRFTWRSFAREVAYPIILWGLLWLLADVLWWLRGHTRLGPTLPGLVLPLVPLMARLTSGKRWRNTACAVLSFCLPTFTLRLLLSLMLGTAPMTEDPAEKLHFCLVTIAEFLHANAATNIVGLLVILCCYRSSAPTAERFAFLSVTRVAVVATLSVTTLFAGTAIALADLAPDMARAADSSNVRH
jgi:hypothetical protein